MSEQDDTPPPPTEAKDFGGGEAVEQEEQAPQPDEPVESGEEIAEAQEGQDGQEKPEETEADDDESADEETAPELTEPEDPEKDPDEKAEEEAEDPEEAAEAEATEAGKTQPADEPASEASEDDAEDDAADGDDEEQSEGGEQQQPLSPALERHIFDGEIDQDTGELAGYHHREGGQDQGDSKLVSRQSPDEDGVYKGKWTMDGRTDEKGSTFFPDSYSRDDVRGATREAWDNRQPTGVENQWKGVTSQGMTIRGYVNGERSVADSTEDDITTAYPIRKSRR